MPATKGVVSCYSRAITSLIDVQCASEASRFVIWSYRIGKKQEELLIDLIPPKAWMGLRSSKIGEK